MAEIALLLTLALGASGLTYHPIRVDEFATRKLTHVCTTGLVAMKKREDDRDWHYRLVSDTPARAGFIVAEVTEQTPLPAPFRPRVGDRVEVCGTRRYDDAPGHGFWEVHPVEKARILQSGRPKVLGAVGIPAMRTAQAMVPSPVRTPRRQGLRSAGPNRQTTTYCLASTLAHQGIDCHHPAHSHNAADARRKHLLISECGTRAFVDASTSERSELLRDVAVSSVELNARMPTHMRIAVRERALAFKQASHPRNVGRAHGASYLEVHPVERARVLPEAAAR